jgi:hypothetical protein
MSDELRTKLSDKLKSSVKERLGQTWDQLQELWQVEVQEALEDLAQVSLLALTSDEVSQEVLHAKARVANWSFVGADLVREAVKEALKELLELLGAAVKGLIK